MKNFNNLLFFLVDIIYNLKIKYKLIFIFKFVFILFRFLTNDVNYDPSFELEFRGPVAMKGRPEPMKVWFLNRNRMVTSELKSAIEDIKT